MVPHWYPNKLGMMFPQYLNYAYVFLLLQSLIVLIEVCINLKNPTFLKTSILAFILSSALFCVSNIYFNYFGYNRWILETPAVLLSITSVAVLSFLCEFKISRPVIVFGVLIILIQQSVALLVNPSTEDFSVFRDFRVYLRLAFSVFVFVLVLNFFLKIIKKYSAENIYNRQLTRWSLLFVINCTLILLANIVRTFLGTPNLYSRFLVIASLLSTVLAILFRPKFLNYSKRKPLATDMFRKKVEFGLSYDTFFETFFANSYYLDREASLDRLSNTLKINSESLTNFIFVNYGLSYTDLVNKNRINYFLDLVRKGESKEFTIEGLSYKCGFNTRHQLYKCFKKFHGGSPSDYIQTLH